VPGRPAARAPRVPRAGEGSEGGGQGLGCAARRVHEGSRLTEYVPGHESYHTMPTRLYPEGSPVKDV
jgi:hypothetical protein